ncbi:hypothetical protein HJFPF1_12802 [Paramyrothecium foliicola]|nr:hypothetical protein HJFPF1_12802 [Paramyrothecium foliicola]
MPKRSLDIGKFDMASMPSDKVQRKTERSHEENQERAYIAASRRADRSIEARVQSARMASEIHKKRTGKGFRITEEIVMKEEMYEEEEDEFPRSYRLLGSHMQTSSPEMNFRVEAYLSNRVAMSALLARTNDDWRENEINRLFAQSFPNVGKQAQQMSQRMSNPEYPGQTVQREDASQSPISPTFSHVNYQQQPATTTQAQHRRSTSCVAPSEPTSQDGGVSPPALTPGSNGSHSAETPRTWSTPSLSHTMPTAYNTTESPFTTELPAEAKMLLGGVDMNNAFTQSLYGQDWMNQAPYYDGSEVPRAVKMEETEQEPYPDLFDNNNAIPSLKWDPMAQSGGAVDDSWESFIDDAAWRNDK